MKSNKYALLLLLASTGSLACGNGMYATVIHQSDPMVKDYGHTVAGVGYAKSYKQKVEFSGMIGVPVLKNDKHQNTVDWDYNIPVATGQIRWFFW